MRPGDLSDWTVVSSTNNHRLHRELRRTLPALWRPSPILSSRECVSKNLDVDRCTVIEMPNTNQMLLSDGLVGAVRIDIVKATIGPNSAAACGWSSSPGQVLRIGPVQPFPQFAPPVHKIIFTTNTNECLDCQIREVPVNRWHLPSFTSVVKLLWSSSTAVEDTR